MIGSKTRQRTMRCFVASLLQSDLTTSELQQIAFELSKGSLGRELSEIIYEVTLFFRESASEDNAPATAEPNSEAVYSLIQERHLTKSMVLQLMKISRPDIGTREMKALERKPLRDMLRTFFVNSPPESSDKLLGMLKGESGDAYLTGISKRE